MAVETMDEGRLVSFPRNSRFGEVNVGRVERWLSLVAGGALAAYGLKQRNRTGAAAAAAGAALLYRGATGHCALYDAAGIDTAGIATARNGHAASGSDTRERLGGRRGVLVEECVTIGQPADAVYRFWRDCENLPQCMNHLDEVTVREDGTSHWVARGPAGLNASWDARVINEIPNELIAWQSLAGSTVATAGSVHFDSVPGGTEVRVRLQYNPPAGKAGAAAAWMFGEEPTVQVREDLERLQELMEASER